jgi:hypothetical protein
MPTGFPFDNELAGILILVVGFLFHFGGQAVSVLNWNLATRLGLQEDGMPSEYKVYEHAIAVADVLVGWVYGVAGVGLIFGAPWAYKLAWLPGSILVYHAIGFWVWTGNAHRSGVRLSTSRSPFRISWFLANLVTGLLALFVAWNGS